MRKLYYVGKAEDGFGWGIANTNLIRELGKLCDVVPCTGKHEFDAPVFVPVADSSLNPICKIKKAPKVLGYCFTEWPLTDDALRNSRQYDVLFAGSTWNTEKLKTAGIKHAKTLIQGVDFERFKPLPPSERKGFVVFSGGKYEFRKGQDFVLKAMRHFMQQRSDVVLINAWHNPWPQTMASMRNSWLINPEKPFDGLPMDRVITIPPIPNEKTPEVYAAAHIGLFPNRCEAGTNLVMCEFMACSRPVIASASHGHMDVLSEAALKLNTGDYDPAGWFNVPTCDIIAQLEYAYTHREELEERGKRCRAKIEQFTWKSCAQKIVDEAFSPAK